MQLEMMVMDLEFREDNDVFLLGEKLYEEWMQTHELAAAKEGWSIYPNTCAAGSPLVVDVDASALDAPPTIEALLTLVLNGVEPHHAAARVLLEHTDPGVLKRLGRKIHKAG